MAYLMGYQIPVTWLDFVFLYQALDYKQISYEKTGFHLFVEVEYTCLSWPRFSISWHLINGIIHFSQLLKTGFNSTIEFFKFGLSFNVASSRQLLKNAKKQLVKIRTEFIYPKTDWWAVTNLLRIADVSEFKAQNPCT